MQVAVANGFAHMRVFGYARAIERVHAELGEMVKAGSVIDATNMAPFAEGFRSSDKMLGRWAAFPVCRTADEYRINPLPRNGKMLLPVLADESDAPASEPRSPMLENLASAPS